MNVVKRFWGWIDRSIQRKLIFWSLGFWVVSVSVLSLTFFRVGQVEITRQTRERNVQLASVMSRDINSQTSVILSDIRLFARRLEATAPDLEAQTATMLSLRLAAPQRYKAVYYFDPQNTLLIRLDDPPDSLVVIKSAAEIVARSPAPVDIEILDTARATRETSMSISDVRFTALEHVPVMYVGVPIKLSGGQTMAVVFEVDLHDLWQRIDLNTVGQSGFTYAVSRSGVIIANPEPTYIGREIPAEIGPLIRGFEGYAEYTDPSGGQNLIAAYSPVGGSIGWGIVVVQDKSEAFAPVVRNGAIIIGIWLVLAVLGTAGIWIVIRNFTRPIVDLTETTQSIARTGDLTKTIKVKRTDEVGQMSLAFDQMIERLQTSEGRVAQAAAEERNRLARDLHDAVSQTLFSASLIAEVLPRIWDKNQPEGRRRLEEIRQLTRGALAEMRTLLLELRPSALVEAEIDSLMHQLGESITGRSRVPVTVEIEGNSPVPTEVKIAFYRIAQEALNNVAKHAGAKEAKVSLNCSPEEILLKVCDNGRGFDVDGVEHKSLGMGIIRERAKEIGAYLSIKSESGHGTEITVTWKNGTALNSKESESAE